MNAALMLAMRGIGKGLSRMLGRKEREVMLWMQEGSGRDQVGRRVDIDGRRGRVVGGTLLTITIEWD